MSLPRSQTPTAPPSSPLLMRSLSKTSSLLSAAKKPYNKMFAPATPQPDPDQDDTWQVSEPYSAVISRKQHPRDPSALLSLRDVLRRGGQHINTPSGEQPSLILSDASSTVSRTVDTGASALSGQPSVEANPVNGNAPGLPKEEELGGEVSSHVETGTENTANSSILGSMASTVDAHIQRGNTASVISVTSDATIGPANGGPIVQMIRPPTPPPKDQGEKEEQGNSPAFPANTHPTNFFAASLTNGLTNAMRFVLPGDRPSLLGQSNNGLLSVESSIDEQPHIKYDWTIGKRLKFSCTVYYAKQFDALRHRCGVNHMYLKSLSRSANWAAEGGKSKSNFWKTSDNRFIIKTLVNAWNVADL
jgi:1-phosphatidylinositol-3-phosphate 5-kinase